MCFAVIIVVRPDVFDWFCHFSIKRQVFGRVGIDSVAGPSEVLLISDKSMPEKHAALDLLAQHGKYKMWVKPTSEMSFLYGNHLLKSGLGRVTENTPTNQGVVILSMSDVPLGFGVCAKSTQECRKADPSAVVCFHQADIGEYLRAEDDMVPGKKE